jgi:hypothetical protein
MQQARVWLEVKKHYEKLLLNIIAHGIPAFVLNKIPGF